MEIAFPIHDFHGSRGPHPRLSKNNTTMEDLWVRLVRSKYNCGNEMLPRISRPSQETKLWNRFRRMWPIFNQNLCWRVGNGRRVKFWQDKWIRNAYALMQYPWAGQVIEAADLTIANLFSPSRDWNLRLIQSLFPRDFVNKIKALPPPSASNSDDSIAWGLRKDAKPAMVCIANDLQEWKDFPKGLKVLLFDGDINSAYEIRAKLEAMDYNVTSPFHLFSSIMSSSSEHGLNSSSVEILSQPPSAVVTRCRFGRRGEEIPSDKE
ncbi:unnamed protein product [Lupinus luteus]|uniref:Uncharacterized protein n=1 Tax=Lupinus luteus TaxID=3873 RepID=A0AAV1WJV9_LUPLU